MRRRTPIKGEHLFTVARASFLFYTPPCELVIMSKVETLRLSLEPLLSIEPKSRLKARIIFQYHAMPAMFEYV